MNARSLLRPQLFSTIKRSGFQIEQSHAYSAQAQKKLFTPGPLGVSMTTKEAMLEDVRSRDKKFMTLIKEIRSKLVQLAGVTEDDFTCVPMQGAGTFALEAVLSTAVPRDGRILILENGAYGKRQVKICEVLAIDFHHASFPEDCRITADQVQALLLEHQAPFSMVSIVHCETSSGVFNDVEQVGRVVKKHSTDSVYFVDAMSSFGAVPLSMESSCIDYLVSSANKCIEGVPGFGYALCRKEHLLATKGNARSYSLDLEDQYQGLERSGQFRFTPPTHAMLAFRQALQGLEAEGGVQGRSQRYQANRAVLRQGMRELGFKEFLSEDHTGYIITSYCFPQHPNFDFTAFYEKLAAKGMVIYPGKVLDADCFRIGNIGDLHPSDMEDLLEAIKEVCNEINIPLPIN